MKLELKRPLAIFDLETTGLNIPTDRIIDISILKVHPDGKEEIKNWRVNPGIPIPAESFQFHGITEADVASAPPFKAVAKDIARFLQNCDLSGYNALKFDIPMLMEEFLRNEVDFDLKNRHLVDVQNIFMKMEPRTLKGAVRFFCERELEDAHSAEADTVATYDVLKAMLYKYKDKEYEDNLGNKSKPVLNDVEALHRFSHHHRNADLAGQIIFDDENREMFNFGKHKGRLVEDVFTDEPSYYDWMMRGSFPLYTKKLITAIKLRLSGKNVKM
ncbi:MAG: 3'-5' exonuclease [Bacteroidales bacterium]|nr:3'-5' exonuclease [Bacteroidales bacterium]